jgi:thymidine kinase
LLCQARTFSASIGLHTGAKSTARCDSLTRGGDDVDIVKGNMGWIEVIVGPMFSGKSEELIRRLRRAEIGRQRVQIFKPVIDQRYSKNGIVSHSGLEIPSELVSSGTEILEKVAPRTEVVGIDEAQFLGESIVGVCARLAELGKRVIVAGLDTDFMGRPFEPMPRLLAVAEEITKLLAICMSCGNPAVHTQRIVASEELIVVGAGGMYEARCRRCFEPQLAQQKIEEQEKAGGMNIRAAARAASS